MSIQLKKKPLKTQLTLFLKKKSQLIIKLKGKNTFKEQKQLLSGNHSLTDAFLTNSPTEFELSLRDMEGETQAVVEGEI